MSHEPTLVDKPIIRLAFVALIALGFCALLYNFAYIWVGSLTNGPDAPLSEEYQIHKAALSDLSDDISMLEGNADMKFPASAYEIYAYVSGFRELYTVIRFSMKASELPAFIKTTLCDKPLENFIPTAEQKEGKSNLEWFDPYQSKTLQRCFGESEFAYQRIYVDITDPQTYLIYISDSTRDSTPLALTPQKTETIHP